MSLDINGEKCALCKAYLFDEDDIVYCPECGAPHHRECYNSISRCALEEFHGTENQYKKSEPPKSSEQSYQANDNYITCGMCGEKYEKDEDFCPNCNTPNVSKSGGRFVTFDFTGGVANETDMGDNVKAQDAKMFVGINSHRYLPKFLNFKNGQRASWNWLAFLTPSAWLMSRKMYLLGSIIAAFQIALTMLTVPFVNALNTIDASTSSNYFDYMSVILESFSLIGEVALYTAFIASVIDLAIRVIFAILGDYIYKKYAFSKINSIKSLSDYNSENLRKKGGVSLWGALIGFFAVRYLPTLIAYMLGMLQ